MVILLELNGIQLNQPIIDEMNKVPKAFKIQDELKLSDLQTTEMPGDYFFDIKDNNFSVGFVTLTEVCFEVVEFDILIYERFRGKGYLKKVLSLIKKWIIENKDYLYLDAIVYLDSESFEIMDSLLIKDGFLVSKNGDNNIYRKRLGGGN